MLRLLIIAAVVYFLYRGLNRWLRGPASPFGDRLGHGDATAVDDIMVKDPQCQAYFPKRKAVQARIDGRDHYFCSTTCRDKFVETQAHADSE
jgi:YHS domain-containing protein